MKKAYEFYYEEYLDKLRIVNFSYSHVLYLHKQFWEKEGDENES